ncbi:MAG: hypothetical protein D4R56_00890 [Deltaproteobacteria bacterium]|nr:MAG: hypothetical protein D4R56_00890 [Deltaproteobacteria bacterium]
MIFYVYMSPDVVEDANEGGPYALDSLIGILQGFLQNCFIAEFEDDRFQRAFYSNVSQLPASNARKKILTLFGQLKNRHHFISCLAPNYFGVDDDLSCAIKQAEDVLLDLLLIATKENFQPVTLKTEVAMLDNYNQSNFASSRSILAQKGKTLKPNQLGQSELLDKIFKKALMYASRIEICDRIFGRKFGDNFEYSFVTMFRWLEKNVADPVRLEKIIIHCEKPPGYGDDNMKVKLSPIKSGRFSKIIIEIRFYNKDSQFEGDPLPHDRYLMTDQVAFDIGRGMDFLSKRTRGNRDISINYKDPDEISALIGEYRQYNTSVPVVL